MPPPNTPLAVLNWIERHARYIEIQELTRGTRRKNRVILRYLSSHATEVETIGGTTLAGAVMKADLRIQAANGAVRKAS